LIVVFSGTLHAHPHIFIDNTVTIVFDEEGMAGIKLHWVFDEMYSNMLIYDYDTDQNKEFSAKELDILQNEAFENIAEYSYFTHININGKKFEKRYIEDFSASIENERVIYTFFVNCHVKAHTSDKKIEISVYDETYYTDIALEGMKSIKTKGADKFDHTLRLKDDMDNSFYYGQAIPQVIILTFKKK
jgi:ABC-type uncharacterized transport system substrate-binding protein